MCKWCINIIYPEIFSLCCTHKVCIGFSILHNCTVIRIRNCSFMITHKACVIIRFFIISWTWNIFRFIFHIFAVRNLWYKHSTILLNINTTHIRFCFILPWSRIFFTRQIVFSGLIRFKHLTRNLACCKISNTIPIFNALFFRIVACWTNCILT